MREKANSALGRYTEFSEKETGKQEGKS